MNPNDQEDAGLTGREIKDSALNNMPIEAIEKQYSTAAKTSKAKSINPRLVTPIAALGTLIAFIVVVGGGLLIYNAIFSEETRLSGKTAEPSSETSQQSGDNQEPPESEASGESGTCSTDSAMPDQACTAVLSIQEDKTINNKFLSANVVNQIAILPSNSTITIREDTWVVVNDGFAEVEAEVDTGTFGTYIVLGTLEDQNGQWIITDIQIVEQL